MPQSIRDRLVTPACLLLLLGGCAMNPYLAPPDVAAPPSSATVLLDGLAYRVLHRGSGTTHPAPDSMVTMNYTGWTADEIGRGHV